MSKLRVHCFSISIDGYGAGPDQSVENPLGVGGEDLHTWLIATRSWQSLHGKMEGGTEFIFVEDIHRALAEARAAAGENDIQIGGGASTIRQYLEARLIDEMHFAIAPIILGAGEHLLRDL